MLSSLRKRSARTFIAAIAAVLVFPAAAVSVPGPSEPQTVAGVEFLGEVVIPTGTLFDGTEVGGLSSITYDVQRDVFYVLSDDQGNRPTGDPVRFYTVAIDASDGSLDPGDVAFTNVTGMFEGRRKALVSPDPEGLAITRQGYMFTSSEGNIFTDPIADPYIRRLNRNGRVSTELPIPDHYTPNGIDFGVRFNLSFESLNLTPDGRTLVTAGEGALFQDGPSSTFTNGSLARILLFDVRTATPVAEYVYDVAPWAEDSTIFGVNGIVELLPIDDFGTMLVMERSFSVGGVLGGGTGNVVWINEITTDGATDVLGIDALYDSGVPIAHTPVSQRQVFAFDELGIPIDNVEGMTFGPDLPDGRKMLVIVSDNNFSAGQFTQFVVLAVDVVPVD